MSFFGTRHVDDIAAVQVETLFTLGSDGTLQSVNDLGSPKAPRCFLSRTASGRGYWTDGRESDELARALNSWQRQENTVLDERSSARDIDEILFALGTDDPEMFHGPAYHLPGRIPDIAIPEGIRIRHCELGDAELFERDFPDTARHFTLRQPVVMACEGNQPVSLCCTVRIGRTACEAGTETLRSHRGRGISTAVVAAWMATVRELGSIPLYSTSWDNPASQSVARRTGMRRYAITTSLY